jgi:hypothetical protein
MNHRLDFEAVGLFCLGVVLLYAGWRGWHTPTDIHCGDETCEEALP